uniref:Zgc:158376 n=1 Tax=Sinocyclocheilus rhinocerous TaxID=307959 RepID=A0A673FMW9_9TELE
MSGSKVLGGARRRRTRCRRCQACMRTECGECHFCKDMKKFGGPGRMKQSCLLRQCTAPVLPHTAVCFTCGEAGKEDTVESEEEKFSLSLMECTICNEIIHPSCLKMGKAEGIINDEIPNCWECPKCHKEGKTSKDQGDGLGKRRMDNGEVSRWKLTDEPPPSKKKSLSLEDGARRKKDKELPQESGSKKKIKGARDKHLKKKAKPNSSDSSEANGPNSSSGGGHGSNAAQASTPSQDQRSHHREKLERFKRMCQLLERVRDSSSSSSSSSETDSEPHCLPLNSGPSSPAYGSGAARERSRRLAELGFSASEESEGESVAAQEDEPQTQRRRGDASTRLRRTLAEAEPDDDEEGSGDRAHIMRLFTLAAELANYGRELQEKENSNSSAVSNHRHAAGKAVRGSRIRGAGRQSQSTPWNKSTATANTSVNQLSWEGPGSADQKHSRQKILDFTMYINVCSARRLKRVFVCRCCDKRLWTQIDLSRQRSITPPMLSSIIRRQPVCLNLGYTNISKKQLMWLINRLQGLLELNVAGCSWSSVSALCQSVSVLLLSAAHGENRGGRFQNVTELRLAGLEVTDAVSRLLVRYLPHLSKLDLGQCCHITDQSIHTLTSAISPLRESLTHVSLAGCVKVTEQCLPLLRRCASLQSVDLRSCGLLAPDVCQLHCFPSAEDRLLPRN